MPLYEYRCEDGHATEAYRRVEERNTPLTCGVCDKGATRALTRPAVHWRCSLPGYPTAGEILRGEDPYAGDRRKAQPRTYEPED